MGNQPSKSDGSGTSTPKKSTSTPSLALDRNNGPSFTKSETKESVRSFKSLRSKVKSSDSPRASASALSNVETGSDKGDAASVKSGRSAISKASRTDSGMSPTSVDGSDIFSDEPPPSPLHHATGSHDLTKGGEVSEISDQPVTGSFSLNSHTQPAGKSILVKRADQINPISNDIPPSGDVEEMLSSQAMGMGDIKSSLDDFITRLIDAAYAGKVTKGVCLKNAEITAVCTAAREIFLQQPALLELDAPVKIVGDIHGQYPDLIRLFEMSGSPPSSNFLFLGDYVDRGKQSLETILLLLCYKLKYPENFFLLRGNHECANVTRVYGFYDECKRRCNIKIWKTFVDTFNTLPIAAIVAEKIFCVHGGLSPSLSHMDDIRNIARPTDVPDYGLLNDLLWSDPADMETDWEANERGVSYCFGKKVITQFLERHNFDLVCRAHMVVEDGYEFFNDRVLVTVFSAPNVSVCISRR